MKLRPCQVPDCRVTGARPQDSGRRWRPNLATALDGLSRARSDHRPPSGAWLEAPLGWAIPRPIRANGKQTSSRARVPDRALQLHEHQRAQAEPLACISARMVSVPYLQGRRLGESAEHTHEGAWYAKPNRLWEPRRRAISRRSASRKVASGSETGTALSDAGLDELTNALRPGDRLVVSELSRLGRSLGQVALERDRLDAVIADVVKRQSSVASAGGLRQPAGASSCSRSSLEEIAGLTVAASTSAQASRGARRSHGVYFAADDD